MASYLTAELTDDDSSNDEQIHHKTGIIEESIIESSSVVEDSYSEKSTRIIESGTKKKTTNLRRRSLVKDPDFIISDSDTSADNSRPKPKKINPRQISSIVHSAKDSSDNKSSPINISKKERNNKNVSFTQFRQSRVDSDSDSNSDIVTPRRKPIIKSESDSEGELIRVKKVSKKAIISSESETDADEDVKLHISTSDSEELSLHSIEPADSEEEISKLSTNLNNSRISNEFNFGKKGAIVNSTLLDIDGHPNSPLNKLTAKRMLNRSVETPRVIKHMKESETPLETTKAKKSNKPMNVPIAKHLLNTPKPSTPKASTPKATTHKVMIPKVTTPKAATPKPVTPKIDLHTPKSSQPVIDQMKTPRNVREEIPSRSPSPSGSIEVLSNSDIIDISSSEEDNARALPLKLPNKTIRQTTLDSMFIKKKEEIDKPEGTVIEVSPREYRGQKDKVRKIETEFLRSANLLRTVNLANLPDKGKLILDRHANMDQILKKETEKLSKMVVSKEDTPQPLNSFQLNPNPVNLKTLSWEEIEGKAGRVLPKTFGKQAMSTYNAQKALTLDRLQQLHGSLKTCPSEDQLAEQPRGLKVELMAHQKRALAWMIWREQEKPSGGILADDMGLGKTLTMISLMLKSMETEGSSGEDSNDENQPERASPKFKGGTLIICPASLINQWSGELERRAKRGLASCEIYHGPKRETKPKILSEYNMVITTYSIVMNECEKRGAIFRVRWRRIVMDEAHQVRNHKSQTSVAVCQLAAKSRWALTGTPVHNKELDMYALLKFLRCTPFDDLQVWKRWVGDKSTGGQERLHTVISSLMLRRTKAELMEKGGLTCMPERKWELIPVELDKNEMDVYHKILVFSRTLFAQFLHQRAEKNQDVIDMKYGDNQPQGANQEYFKMRQKLLHLNKVKDVKQHEILVLLLRLRQICCHASLITGMLNEDMDTLGCDEEYESEEINLLDQLNNMTLNDEFNQETSGVAAGLSDDGTTGLKEATKGFLNPSNPVFSKKRVSSKIKTMLKVLKEKIIKTDDKAIVVSQWTSFLNLITYHIKQEGIEFGQLDGTIPVNKRMSIVDKFNDPNDKMKVLLLSLTAGGVGLNLVGANHLFLLDLHWNPQLENQAQDRIYRVGQNKPVFVYKFMATDTIEKRILSLQEKKLDIANSMLTGTKQAIGSKLSLQDLKMLFEM